MNPTILPTAIATTITTAGTVMSEGIGLISNIVDYKKTALMVEAQLAIAEQAYEVSMANVQAEHEQACKTIDAITSQYKKQLKSMEHDKEGLRSEYKEVMAKLRQETDLQMMRVWREIANDIQNRLSDIRGDQMRASVQLSDSLANAGQKEQARVIDVDFSEVIDV